jgi:hypothetical protein
MPDSEFSNGGRESSILSSKRMPPSEDPADSADPTKPSVGIFYSSFLVKID